MAETAVAAAPQAAKQVELSTAQKAAAVIIALGAEKASLVYKYMEDEEVEQIGRASCRERVCQYV